MFRRRRSGAEAVTPDLPITPMLDMSFQLMAFFILTFRPTPTEAQIALALPRADGGAAAVTAPPDLALLDDDEELVVQVFAGDTGGLAEVVAAPKTGPQSLGADPAALFKYLKDRRENGGGKAPKLRFEFADRLNYKYVIKLLDEAKRAGFDRVSPALLNPQPKK
ncbi:MAG: biopolymer transporter ExbD [Gemmataceae bacterium]